MNPSPNLNDMFWIAFQAPYEFYKNIVVRSPKPKPKFEELSLKAKFKYWKKSAKLKNKYISV